MKALASGEYKVAMSVVASIAFSNLACVPDCPDGMVERRDQCVRQGEENLEGGAGGGAGGASGGRSGTGGASGAGAAIGSGGSEPREAGPDVSVGAGGDGAGGTGTGGNGSGGDMSDGDVPDADAEVVPPCDVGRVRSEGRCIPENVYVNATAGNDANDGGPGSPLKTFRAAMTKVHPKQVVNFDQGTWGAGHTDDTFQEPIPEDVVLKRRHDDAGVAFSGGGTASLTFAGTARVEKIAIYEFAAPVVATSGDPTLTFVTFGSSNASATIAGTAHVTCINCQFEGQTTTGAPLIVVEGESTLQLVSSHFSRTTARQPIGIHVNEGANLVFDGGSFQGDFMECIKSNTSGAIALHSVHCTSEGLVSFDLGNAEEGPSELVELDGCSAVGMVQINGVFERVRIRRSTLRNVQLFGSDRTDDLGIPNDLGDNKFVTEGMIYPVPHVAVMGWGNVIRATGNTWRPNVQGANASGRYPQREDGGAPYVVRQGEGDLNVGVAPDHTDGGGRPPSRVEL